MTPATNNTRLFAPDKLKKITKDINVVCTYLLEW